MKHLSISLTLFLSLSGNLLAANCTPEVDGKKVLIELVNEEGKIIYSKQHKIRKKEKYAGLMSSTKALEVLVTDTSKNVKIKNPKMSFSPAGTITKVFTRDGSALALIGGCPLSNIKLYTRAGKQKKPFVHADVIERASKSTVVKLPENGESAKKEEKTKPVKEVESRKRRAQVEETKQASQAVSKKVEPTTRTSSRTKARETPEIGTKAEKKTKSKKKKVVKADTSKDKGNSELIGTIPISGGFVEDWLLLVYLYKNEIEDSNTLITVLGKVYGEEWTDKAKNEFEARRYMSKFKKRLLEDAKKAGVNRNVIFAADLGQYNFDESVYIVKQLSRFGQTLTTLKLDENNNEFPVHMKPEKAELVRNKIAENSPNGLPIYGRFNVKVVGCKKDRENRPFNPRYYECEGKVKSMDFYATLNRQISQDKFLLYAENWLFSIDKS